MRSLLFPLLLLAVAAAAQDQATVVLYRPSKTIGFALHPSIYCDGTEVARIGNGSFIEINVPVGKHEISAAYAENPEFSEWAAGHTYFYRFQLLSWTKGRAKLKAVPEEEARQEIKKLKRNEVTASCPAPAS